jgi:hypothetical protein
MILLPLEDLKIISKSAVLRSLLILLRLVMIWLLAHIQRYSEIKNRRETHQLIEIIAYCILVDATK